MYPVLSVLIAETAPAPLVQAPVNNMTSIKALADSPALTSIPSDYLFTSINHDHDQVVEDLEEKEEDSPPVIDYSLLTSGTSHQRSMVIHQLNKACLDWGFFMVINHGVPESLIRSMIDLSGEFFDLPEGEKQAYQGKGVLEPIRCGTSFNHSAETVHFWRDFLKAFVHPEFHSPSKPSGFRECSLEYTRKVSKVAQEVLKGISESLGLEPDCINKAVNLERGLKILIANCYPPCPQPDLALGLPPHSDHGLLTFLVQNGNDGLQVKHKGKWVTVHATPNAFLVIVADHLEILSNGKYKSVLHRAVVNNKATRISVALSNGPSLDSVVSPAQELVDSDVPAYSGMQYKEYLEFQQSNKLDGKSCLYRLCNPIVK